MGCFSGRSDGGVEGVCRGECNSTSCFLGGGCGFESYSTIIRTCLLLFTALQNSRMPTSGIFAYLETSHASSLEQTDKDSTWKTPNVCKSQPTRLSRM